MDMTSAFSQLNWLSILAAAISTFVVGGIWYGPFFGKTWMSELGFTEEDLTKRSQFKIFTGAALLNLIMAFNLAMFLGTKVDIIFWISASFFTGLGFISAFLGVLYLFEGRSLKLFLINSGFAIVSFVTMGLIMGVMN